LPSNNKIRETTKGCKPSKQVGKKKWRVNNKVGLGSWKKQKKAPRLLTTQGSVGRGGGLFTLHGQKKIPAWELRQAIVREVIVWKKKTQPKGGKTKVSSDVGGVGGGYG